MKKYKLSDSEIRLLLLFFAVLMLVGAYFLSYRKNMERAKEIEAQNDGDRAYAEMLESMVSHRAEMEAQTAEYNQAIADIVAKYPSELTTEKVIAIIKEMENRTGVSVNDISFSMDNPIVGMTDSVVQYMYTETEDIEGWELKDGEGGEIQVVSAGASSIGYRDTLNMTYKADYSAFKEMISYIYRLPDRSTLPSILASYDSVTKTVSGSITVNMYYIPNTGKEYGVPDVGNYDKSVPNIFDNGLASQQESEVVSDGEDVIDGEEASNE